MMDGVEKKIGVAGRKKMKCAHVFDQDLVYDHVLYKANKIQTLFHSNTVIPNLKSTGSHDIPTLNKEFLLLTCWHQRKQYLELQSCQRVSFWDEQPCADQPKQRDRHEPLRQVHHQHTLQAESIQFHWAHLLQENISKENSRWECMWEWMYLIKFLIWVRMPAYILRTDTLLFLNHISQLNNKHGIYIAHDHAQKNKIWTASELQKDQQTSYQRQIKKMQKRNREIFQ